MEGPVGWVVYFDAQRAYGKIGAMNFLLPHVRVELLIRTSLAARQGAVRKGDGAAASAARSSSGRRHIFTMP